MEKKDRKDALRQYQRYLKLQKGFTPNTLDAYLRDVQKLLLYLKGEGIDPLEVKLDDLEHFSASLHDLGIAPSSQARILCGVRSFYRFLNLDGWIEQDPAELLESPKQGEHLPEYLSTAEVDQLEAIIDVSKWEGHRNRAIIEVLFSCGLRVSELVNLPLSNLYLDEGFIRVSGKGRKERLVPIPGQPPKLYDEEPGCKFAERCPFRKAECSGTVSLRRIGPDHFISCTGGVSNE